LTHPERFRDMKVGVVISGGNLSMEILRRVA
jgi:hypothetical protein